MARIKKEDLVIVNSGSDKGKSGRVIDVLKNDKLLVEGVNLKTKHNRITQTQKGATAGGIETIEGPIHISNVSLLDPETKVPTRIRYNVEKKGDKVVKTRVSVKSGKAI
jgi:large subunit ribosomal protein L24